LKIEPADHDESILVKRCPNSGDGENSPRPQKQESPACNVLALSSEERIRHFNEVGPTLRSLKKSVRELNDGLEFEFPGDRATLQLLAEWIVQERDCCRFFEITLRLEPEGGAAWLRLTGSKSMAELALGSFGIADSR
jgi:hypothetical protein